MQVNIIITNRVFPKVVFKKKTIFLDFYIKEDISQGSYYRRNRLVTCSTCKTGLVTHSSRLTTRSTRSICLPTRSTCKTTRSTHNTRFFTSSTGLSIRLSIRSTRLSTGSTRLFTRNICLSTRSTCSTICWSFYNWSNISLMWWEINSKQ